MKKQLIWWSSILNSGIGGIIVSHANYKGCHNNSNSFQDIKISKQIECNNFILTLGSGLLAFFFFFWVII